MSLQGRVENAECRSLILQLYPLVLGEIQHWAYSGSTCNEVTAQSELIPSPSLYLRA